MSKRNASLDLTKRSQILSSVIELGDPRVGVVRHVLCRFQ